MRNKFYQGLCYFGIVVTIILAGLDIYNSIHKYTESVITRSTLISNIIINSLCYIALIAILVWMIIVRKNRK